jgi:hypothetical protein
MARCLRNISSLGRSLWLHLALLLIILSHPSHAYRVGDAIDTILQTPSGISDAMRQQMPRFGVSTQAIFEGLPASHFSLAFEEGFRQLPWVDIVNSHERALEKIIVTFVYSKSGGGAIHSVSSQSTYSSSSDPSNRSFRADYIWIEEEAVDPNAGAAVMFLATLGAMAVLLLHTCGFTGDSSHDHASSVDGGLYAGYSDQASVMSSSSEPKWE